jgi:hypothetical protein
MKKLLYTMAMAGTAVLMACESQTSEGIISKSADEQARIEVFGRRSTKLDPFKTGIVVNGYGQSDTLYTEIYARGLNEESVVIEWQSNTQSTVTFVQQDDSKRIMNVRFSKDGNSLKELTAK